MSSHLGECLRFIGNKKDFCYRLGDLPPSLITAVWHKQGKRLTKWEIKDLMQKIMEEIGNEFNGR